MEAYIYSSDRKDKRYTVFLFNRHEDYMIASIDFGSKNGDTFIDHRNNKKRENYIARHSKLNENWDDPKTAGFWSRWLLWEKPTLKEAKENITKKFKINFTN